MAEYTYIKPSELDLLPPEQIDGSTLGPVVKDGKTWRVDLSFVKTAADNANDKAALANTAADNADTSANNADAAASNADTKAGLADTAATAANNAANAATTAAGSANTAATAANDAATAANSAASAANTAAGNAQTVADTYVAELNERISSDELQTLYPLVPFTRRVAADSGSIRSKGVAKRLLDFCIENDLFGDTKILICPEIGIKERVSGVQKFATKAYSGEFTPNDAVQTTEASQPYISGNIAPNERYSLKNPNGGTRYVTHPAISFAANQAWSTIFYLNWSGSAYIDTYLLSSISQYLNILSLQANNKGRIYLSGNNFNAQSNIDTTTKLVGKSFTIAYVYNGVDKVSIYINGVFSEQLLISDSFTFSSIFESQTIYVFSGNIPYHRIQSGAMTAAQVASEHTLLRSIFPEIESVKIGTQEWATSNCEMVATPQGNVIQEMQLAAGINFMGSGDSFNFEGNTLGSWTNYRTGIISIDASSQLGSVHSLKVNPNDTEYDGAIIDTGASIAPGKWHKITFDYKINHSNWRFMISSNSNMPASGAALPATVIPNSNGATASFNLYFKSANTSAYNAFITINNFSATSDLGYFDNITVKQIGWAESTELYNALITQGYSEADALKESAMWCHYNNDSANGAIYGKLYNWYAVKLLQTDIDLYNAANPTTPWGWHVPTSAEFTTLQTYLGGVAVAGGKMKMAGTEYWPSPNIADNSSGLTLLGTGYRSASGAFSTLFSLLWGSDKYCSQTTNNSANMDILNGTNYVREGYSLRLIKD